MSKNKKLTENMGEYQKQYFENRREDLKKREICSLCGSQYTVWNKSHHLQSKKHKNILEKIEFDRIKKECDQKTVVLEEYEQLKKTLKEYEQAKLTFDELTNDLRKLTH